MIGGQADDIETAPQAQDKRILNSIRARKTGRLMEAACRIGAICGSATTDAVESLGQYGLRLGLAFQMADDLLDVVPADVGASSDLPASDGVGGHNRGRVRGRRGAGGAGGQPAESCVAKAPEWVPATS